MRPVGVIEDLEFNDYWAGEPKVDNDTPFIASLLGEEDEEQGDECCSQQTDWLSCIQTVQRLGRIMDEDEPKVLIPVITGNIVLRDLPYSVKQRLVAVKRSMDWNSWADMAYWVHENSEKINHLNSNGTMKNLATLFAETCR